MCRYYYIITSVLACCREVPGVGWCCAAALPRPRSPRSTSGRTMVLTSGSVCTVTGQWRIVHLQYIDFRSDANPSSLYLRRRVTMHRVRVRARKGASLLETGRVARRDGLITAGGEISFRFRLVVFAWSFSQCGFSRVSLCRGTRSRSARVSRVWSAAVSSAGPCRRQSELGARGL